MALNPNVEEGSKAKACFHKAKYATRQESHQSRTEKNQEPFVEHQLKTLLPWFCEKCRQKKSAVMGRHILPKKFPTIAFLEKKCLRLTLNVMRSVEVSGSRASSDAAAILQANVRPAKFANPTPLPMYNLLVIGGGSAGLVSSRMAADLGAKVALVEKHALGGDCLNFGCVPSKALIRAAKAWHEKKVGGFGVCKSDDGLSSFDEAMDYVRNVRADISSHDSVGALKEENIDVFFGNGQFKSDRVFVVDGVEIHFYRAIIATGSRALKPPISGLSEIPFLTNEQIFDLEEKPKSVVIAGGGPIGCELGQALNRLGVGVTLIERGQSLLAREDFDVGIAITNVLKEEGVQVFLQSHVCGVKKTDSGLVEVCFEREDGPAKEQSKVVAEKLLLATGRTPNIEGLNLEACGVAFNSRMILVDQFMMTKNKRIFAAGDCCHELKFTHTAAMMARTAVNNALFQKFFTSRSVFKTHAIPWVTYTDPEVARVGKSEADLKLEGERYTVTTVSAIENDRHITERATIGFIKLLTQEKGSKILGAVIVGSEAGEMLSELTLAIEQGLTPKSISKLVHPYPTKAELVARVCEKWHLETTKLKYGKIVKGWLHDQLK